MGLKSRMVLVLAGFVLAASPALAQRPAADISLSTSDAGVPVTVLGEVRAEVHPKSMMPKTPSRDTADQQLREKAAKLGADAVVSIKYENNNPMFSKKGFIAVGKAVKFAYQSAAASTPVALAAAPSFSAAGPPAVLPAAPTPATVVALPPPAATVPVAPVTAAAVAPAAAGVIMLSEQNIARAYTVLGPISAEVNMASVSLDKTGRQVLDEEIRSQAKKLGADAVVLIKYAPAAAGKGPSAIGVAVKFQ